MYSLSGDLLSGHTFNNCGQNTNDYFPLYKDLPINYQTPTSWLRTIH